MDRSFFQRSSHNSRTSRSSSTPSYQMATLAPKPYSDAPSSTSSTTHRSGSPPPFLDSPVASPAPHARIKVTPNGSPSRIRRPQRVQFEQIPPPITASVFLGQSQVSRAERPGSSSSPSRSRLGQSFAALGASVHASVTSANTPHTPTNPLAALSRREKAIQAGLQSLLDAQSAGLIQGRGPSSDVGSEFGSDGGDSTPTSRSIFPEQSQKNGISIHSGYGNGYGSERADSRNRRDKGQVVPVRQPKPKIISLRSARRGILNSINDLSLLKSHESQILQDASSNLSRVLTQVTEWESKIRGFSSEMATIEAGSEGREISELTVEKGAVESDIRELEERLLQLKAREGMLGRRIEECKNRREARISSFREGRREVEREVGSFLERPPVEVIEAGGMLPPAGSSVDEDAGEVEGELFLSLPPKRRTLEMARLFLAGGMSSIQKQDHKLTIEKDALEAGSQTWAEVVDVVTSFENDLRSQMANGTGSNTDGVKDLKRQIGKMEGVVEQLAGHLSVAETKGWNLLICAIGAELQAFREGYQILKDVLESIEPQALVALPTTDGLLELPTTNDGEGDTKATSRREESFRSDGDVSRGTGLMGSAYESAAEFPTATRSNSEFPEEVRTEKEYRSESEDDGPHPDLLRETEDDEPHPDLLMEREEDDGPPQDLLTDIHDDVD